MKPLIIGILILFTQVFFVTADCPGEIVKTSHKIERNEVELSLQRFHDPTTLSSNSHIILVHGLTYSSHKFNVEYEDYSLVRFFSKNGFIVWTLDISGYGLSGIPKNGFEVDSNYAAADLAAAVQYIINKSDVKRVDLLGWSWGTLIISRFAVLHPGLVRKLVLYSPALNGFNGEPPQYPWHKNTWSHAADDFQKLPDGSIDYSKIDKAVANIFISNCWKFDRDRSPNGGRREYMQSPRVLLVDPEKVKNPILIIAGSKDPYLDIEMLTSFFEKLPFKNSSKMIKLEGAGHLMTLEKDFYKIFQKEVLGFLCEKKED